MVKAKKKVIILGVLIIAIIALGFIFLSFLNAEKYEKGDFIYYDPVKNVKCDKATYYTPYNKDTTCYRWVVLEDNHGVKALLDHNYVLDNNSEYLSYDDINDTIKNAQKKWENVRVKAFTIEDALKYLDIDYNEGISNLKKGKKLGNNNYELLGFGNFSNDEKNDKNILHTGFWVTGNKDSYIINNDGKVQRVSNQTKKVGLRPVIVVGKNKVKHDPSFETVKNKDDEKNENRYLLNAIEREDIEGKFKERRIRGLSADDSDLKRIYAGTSSVLPSNTSYGSQALHVIDDRFQVYLSNSSAPRVLTLNYSGGSFDDGSRSSVIYCGHGNDSTYNSNAGKIIVTDDDNDNDGERESGGYHFRIGSSFKGACNSGLKLQTSIQSNHIAVMNDRFIIPSGKTKSDCFKSGDVYFKDICSRYFASTSEKDTGMFVADGVSKMVRRVDISKSSLAARQTLEYHDGYLYKIYSDSSNASGKTGEGTGIIHVINTKLKKSGNKALDDNSSRAYGKSVILYYANFLNSSLQPSGSTRIKMELESVSFPSDDSNTMYLLFNAQGTSNYKPYIYRVNLDSIVSSAGNYYYGTTVNYFDKSTSATPNDKEKYYWDEQIDTNYYDIGATHLGWVYSRTGTGATNISDTYKEKNASIITEVSSTKNGINENLKTVKVSSSKYNNITTVSSINVTDSNIASFLNQIDCTRCTPVVLEDGTEKTSGSFVNNKSYTLRIKATTGNKTGDVVDSGSNILSVPLVIEDIPADQYSITYDLDGGEADNPYNYTSSSPNITLNSPVKDGYTFTGWTGSNGSTPQLNVTIPTGSTGDKSYTANYRVNKLYIKYNMNGGSLSSSHGSTIGTSGNNITINGSTSVLAGTYGGTLGSDGLADYNDPNYINITKTGYSAQSGAEWTTSSDDFGSTFSQSVDYEIDSVANLLDGDKTLELFVNWVPTEYTITYNLNGGTEEENPESYNIDTETFTLKQPTRVGYIFKGWTGSNGTTPQTTVTISKGSMGNKSYTANWQAASYTITYNLNGGSASNPGGYNSTSEEITLQNPTKEGYTFTGWTGSNGSVPQTTVTIPKGSTGNKSYTANWQVTNYSIAYNLNGGTVSTANPTSYNIETEEFTLNNPTKANATFIGWTEYDGDEPELEISLPDDDLGNKTYIANWEYDSYVITYNLNGGTVEDDNPTSYDSNTETFTLNNPTKEGYTFKGWTGSNGTTPQTTVTITKGSTGDKSYTANWEVTNYSITYNLDGGSASNPSSYNIETNTITLSNPTKTGYTFRGWTGSNGSTPQTTVTITKGSTGNKSYTANWTINTYSITYNLNGGSASNPSSYNVGTNTITLSNPTKSGYTFKGWTGSNGTTPQTTVTIQKGSTGNKTYTANWEPTNYSITYNLDGGSATNPTNYNIETNTITLSNPTKSGYIFVGWTGSNGTTPQTTVTITKGSTGNKSYTANWQAPESSYTITYNLNGGSASNPTSYSNTTETFTLNNPTKSGYTFKGWTGSNGSTPETTVTITKGSTGDKTYTANWEINTYAISYTLDGGSATNPTSYNIETNTITLSNPTKNGYTFKGWTGSNGSTPQTTVTIPKGSTGDKNYTANWQVTNYNITYNLDGGSVTNPTSYNIETNTITLSNPTKSGYIFVGWTGSNGTVPQTNVTIPKGSTGNKSYTANWQAPESSYTITYDLAGGTVSQDNPTTYTSTTETFTLHNPTKNGYTFKGWTGSNGNIPENTVTISKGSSGDKTFVANWEENSYTISYNLNGGTVEDDNPTSYSSTTETFTLHNPTKTGYTFIGWTGSNGSTPETSVKILKGSTGNKNYTANWEATNYDITYNLDGGTVSDPNPTSYNIETNNILLHNPTKDGYIFMGWTGSNGATPQIEVTIPKGSTENKTYTANWQAPESSYTITYDLDGGTVSQDNPTTYTSTTETFTLNNPTKNGYTFKGWTGSNGNTPQITVSISKGSSGNKSYIANWEVTNYSITYNLDGGSASNPISYNIETNNITLNNPTKTGYTFKGWTGSNGSTPETNVTIPKGSTENKTYTANWEVINYSITYNLDGGSVSNPSRYNIETNTITLNNPTKSGYIFEGWTGSNGNTPQLNVTIQKGSTGNRFYTANWSKPESSYSITYNLNGGSVTPNNPTSYSTNTETFTLHNPTKNGYKFKGWTGSNGNTPETNVTISKGSEGDRTYTANWKLINYSITYDLDGGYASNPASYNIETNTFTLKIPAKAGHYFRGWTGSNGSIPVTNVTILKGSTGNKTYKANYLKQDDGEDSRKGSSPTDDSSSKTWSAKAYLSHYKQITLEWTRFKNADGYRLCYKNSKSLTYSCNYKASFKDFHPAAGQKYIIKIAPYKHKNGKYTLLSDYKTVSIYTLKKMSKPKVTKKSSKKVKIKITKINGATGYEIYRANKKNGAYKKIKTLKATKKSVVVKASKNKKAYYKVRAYKVNNGKKINAPFSKVKKYTLK